jgi:3-mercaptopyruvate sulfurtransferase SseA
MEEQVKKSIQILVVLLVLAAALFALAACAPAPTPVPPTVAPKATTAPTVAPPAAAKPTEAPKATTTPTTAPIVAPTTAPTVAPTKTAAAVPATLAPIKATPTLVAAAPKSADDIQVISPQLLKALIEGGADIVVVDVQPKSGYDFGHIKGAINLPWAMTIEEDDIWQLSQVKLLVLYCACPPDEKASNTDSGAIAIQLITKFDFQKIALLEGGWNRWVQLGYPVEKGGK